MNKVRQITEKSLEYNKPVQSSTSSRDCTTTTTKHYLIYINNHCTINQSKNKQIKIRQGDG